MTHDGFKIISRGRELPYPAMRIVGLVALAFACGFLTADVIWRIFHG